MKPDADGTLLNLDLHDRAQRSRLPAILVLSCNVLLSLRKGRRPETIPGMPGRLSGPPVLPPPEYNFAEIPTVKSRRPLWDLKHPTDPDWKYE